MKGTRAVAIELIGCALCIVSLSSAAIRSATAADPIGGRPLSPHGAEVKQSAAGGACAQWDLSGSWIARQTNEHFPTFTLRQTGSSLQGEVAYVKRVDDADWTNGQVDGSIHGSAVNLTAYWQDGTIGSYVGTVNAQGRIEGTTTDKMHPEVVTRWHSDRRFNCLRTSNNAMCAQYAQSAVSQNADNLARQCGFTGARWDPVVANHEGWCLVADPALPASETAARSQDLARCDEAAKQAAENLRQGEILKQSEILKQPESLNQPESVKQRRALDDVLIKR